MPGTSNLPSGGAADSALAWYRRTLADVIGASAASQGLDGGPLGGGDPAARRAALAELIDRRFVRRVDPASGRVTFETVGDQVLMVRSGEDDGDPLLAQVTSGYLNAAGAAIAAIPTDLCLPDVCPDRFRDVHAQIRSTLAVIEAAAPRRESMLEVFMNLDELIAPYGLLGRLEEMFGVRPERTVAEERALAAIGVCRQALGCFETAYGDISTPADDSFADVVDAVRRCAGHVAAHVQRARRSLADAGIGDCELEGYVLALRGPHTLGGTTIQEVKLLQAFAVLERAPVRWQATIGVGRPEQIRVVQESARTLQALVTRLSGKAIASHFGLREPHASAVSSTIDRSSSYLNAVFRSILQQPPVPPKAARGPKAGAAVPPPVPSQPPPDDQGPL